MSNPAAPKWRTVTSMRLAPLAALLLAAVVAPAVTSAGGASTLVGTVGPAFNIDLRTGDGARVTHLDPGAFQLEVSDQGEEHSFHLRGPGVDVATPVEPVGTFRFDVTLTDGRYRFFCDIHPTQMRGAFTVGVVAPPPPPPPPPPTVARLSGKVGPGAVISLKRGGAKVKTVRAGTYLVAVADSSARDNFHLKGPGVNRKTGVAAKGKVTWRVVLRRGATYTFRSDASPKLRGTFRAV